eukprot:15352584-Ditylum_brightwellii.AAC.1
MEVKKEDTKMANFCAVVAAVKKDIESGAHRFYKVVLDPNKYIWETRDGMDVISIIIEDEKSSGSKSSSASETSSGLPSFCM